MILICIVGKYLDCLEQSVDSVIMSGVRLHFVIQELSQTVSVSHIVLPRRRIWLWVPDKTKLFCQRRQRIDLSGSDPEELVWRLLNWEPGKENADYLIIESLFRVSEEGQQTIVEQANKERPRWREHVRDEEERELEAIEEEGVYLPKVEKARLTATQIREEAEDAAREGMDSCFRKR